jgi:diguanylate cyclase (GGDEF)-like protein
MRQRLRDLRARHPFARFSFKWPQADGSVLVLQISGKPVFDFNGRFVGYRGAGRDVSEAYFLAERLAHEATHDALTGVINRREFEQRLHRAVASVRSHGVPCALCFLDLDRFKHVNDCAGHRAGDELLRELTALMVGKLRMRDTFARLGGDEFALLLEGCSTEKAVELAQCIVDEVRRFRSASVEHPCQVGLSVGVVPITKAAISAEALLNQADAACYTAKQLGGNQIEVHDFEPKRERSWATPALRRPSEKPFGPWPVTGIVPTYRDLDDVVPYSGLVGNTAPSSAAAQIAQIREARNGGGLAVSQ